MRWHVMLELVGADGTMVVRDLGGGAAVTEYAPRTIGLTLAEGKRILAETQRHLVQAQTEEHCRRRRVCQRCQARRPLKDVRCRRLVSLFGAVAVKAPRFKPCPCAVTCRGTPSPVAEIMPDRCTPEHERVLAKMGALLPYRRARSVLSEFLPLGQMQTVENNPAANALRWRQIGEGGRGSPGTRADPAVAWRVARTGCDFGNNRHHPE